MNGTLKIFSGNLSIVNLSVFGPIQAFPDIFSKLANRFFPKRGQLTNRIFSV